MFVLCLLGVGIFIWCCLVIVFYNCCLGDCGVWVISLRVPLVCGL